MSIILRSISLILVLAIFRIIDQNPDQLLWVESEIININDDWLYFENNTRLLEEVKKASSWQNIDIPHTWNQWDVLDMVPGYRRDGSWYKKELEILIDENSIYKIYFEGSNITTSVYLNDEFVGSHIGGYIGFEMDLTPHLNAAGPNTLFVRVDNEINQEIIPSQKSDFFIYGGITRDVWIKKLPKVHISDCQVSTPEVNMTNASTNVQLSIANGNLCADCELVFEILDDQGKRQFDDFKVPLEKNQSNYEITLPIIKLPRLWSPENPTLYEIKAKIMKGNAVIHQIKEKMGFRFFHFEPHGAFYLNGERLLIRGTHRHEEHAGYGAAMPNELHREDMEMIKEMGANFVRLGHYPQDPEVYKACDELGLIIWDELPWCRGGLGNEVWKDHTKRLLKEQIQHNFNHPSIFFWSLGNEMYWLPDLVGGDDPEKMNTYLTELNSIAHEMDPGRLTAIRKYYEGADIVDVFSPSIWSGWYAGVYEQYEDALDENQKLYPAFLHMEYGGSSHVGRHTEKPISGKGLVDDVKWEEVTNQVGLKNIAQKGDWTENYIVDLFDWYLRLTESRENFTGNAQWAFKDFGTPLRPENAIPYMNQKGLMDRAGNPKDAYFVFKSYWSEDPMVYIESHTWEDRFGPKNETKNIVVYSNCPEVKLSLNGIDQGIKNRNCKDFPGCGLNWDVLFKEGSNILIATGITKDGTRINDTLNVNYSFTSPGKADHFKLEVEKNPIEGSFIIATMLDKNERRVLDYEEPIYFTLNGDGSLITKLGTPYGSQVIQMANGRARIAFIPGAGKAVVEVRNQDFKGTYLVIEPELTEDKLQINDE